MSETLATEVQIGTGSSLETEPLPFEIRQMGYSDLPAVLAMERRSFRAPWSLAMFVLELSKPSGVNLVATEGRDLVGYLVCSRYADVWHLMNVAVDTERRREGLGTQLIEAMLDRAGRTRRYTLEVRTSNLGAIRCYERLGFRRAGRRVRYYSDNGEDAVIMWRGEPDG